MKRILTAIVLLALFGFLCVTPRVTAQDPNAETDAEKTARLVKEYVARSERLRDFGYPLLARAQLDEAKKLDPTSKPLLLEYLRLFTRSQAKQNETLPYVKSLLELYPDDYDTCLEIAWWLFQTYEEPLPPVIKEDDKAALEFAIARLNDEMVVYRELSRYIAKPEADLPKSAAGRPALPLAFLARCAKAAPGTAEVVYLAARDLDIRAKDFHRWSRTDDRLKKPFGDAAQELYALALPFYRTAAKSDMYHVTSTVELVSLLYHMHDYEAAMKAIVAAEQEAPGNLDVAEIRLGIAEDMNDPNKLVDALKKMDELYGDSSSRLDVLVGERIRDQKWDMKYWFAYRELFTMSATERASAIKALLQDKPDFSEIYYVDARNAFSMSNDDKLTPEERANLYRVTLAALLKCKELYDVFPDWSALCANAQWQLGHWEEAAGAYEQVAKLDPKDTEALKHAQAARDIAAGKYTAQDYDVYRMQLNYGDLKDKRSALRIVVTRSPKFFAAQLLLGKVAFMLSDFETAYGAYLAGHKLEPENLECADGVARAAMRTERYEDALRYFQETNKIEKNYQGALRWEGMVAWVAAGKAERQRAFKLWLEASAGSIDASARRKLLEEAVNFEPDFAEALVDLAGINRVAEPRVAENYLIRALSAARDDDTRAAAHREYGRLKLSTNQPGEAIGHFESAYQTLKGDGTDMLLVALCWRDLDKQAEADAALRKLFAEVPNTSLLRPKYSEVLQLDLAAVQPDGPRALSPAYDVGDVSSFHVRIEVESKGGGRIDEKRPPEKQSSIGYDIRLEVLEKPAQNGVWRLRLNFENAPDEFKALEKVSAELRISPWFGLLDEPQLAGQDDVANPAIQAIAEGFTAGLGDAMVAPPYLWTNDLTAGPPHFGGDAVEGSCLEEALGDSFVIKRRGLAGRQLGREDDPNDDHRNFSRALEARVSSGGGKRAVREVEFQILIKELTPAKDDVKFSRIYCKLAAK
ncbi:MAG: hypothetical protein H6839_11035 [Planctomycetes bacterium]|nr:hypothetical protein [Planctomycetota bacterium]